MSKAEVPLTDGKLSALPQPQPKRTLALKLAEVMACVDRVAKNGSNAAQGYKYAMAADVYDAVRSELAKRFVVPVPTVLHAEFTEAPTKSGGVMRYCTLTVRYDFMDGESGEVISSTIVGQGSDSGDKGVYKAQTGATKNCLVNVFLIPTGDDPENEKRAAEPPPPAGLASVKAKLNARSSPTAARSSGATHDRSVSFGFGSGRGQPISALDDKSLAWYAGCLERDLGDPSKAKWHEKTRAQLAALHAEQRMRASDYPDDTSRGADDEPPPPTDADRPF